MSRAPLLLFAPDLPALALAQLEARGRAPGWLIDVARGRFLAATKAGAALLGLPPGEAPPLLDAAMPALGRLRALSEPRARDNSDAPETLVFWTRLGPLRCVCRVEMLAAGASTLALVGAEAQVAGDAEISDGTHEASPLSPSDDAAKLKEIARRIREGQRRAPSSDQRRRPDATSFASTGATAVSPSHAQQAHEADVVAAPLRAILAHELKTPLSAIAAAAEVMKDQRLGPIGSPRYLSYAKDILSTAQHALNVIERMLGDARSGSEAQAPPEAQSPDADLASLDFTEIDTAGLLAATVSELGALAERSGIALRLDLAPRLAHLIADATSLRQIVLNLVTNALKFTPEGGEVTVAARYDGGPLTIAVSDTGAGMGEDEVAQALGRDRPIQGSRRAQKVARSGLGLGLPLVRTLAEANGGTLALESTPGHGTKANVIFPKDRVIPI